MSDSAARARRRLVPLVCILVLHLGALTAVVLRAGPMTDQGLYGDDSFIAHKLAANIAAGKGITQAGAPTNGFQPLFVFLLVPFFWWLDIRQATVASAMLNSVFSAAGCFLTYRILSLLLRPRVGLIGAALWAASDYFTRVALNGLETSLANLLMLAVVLAHLRTVVKDARITGIRCAALGGLMGLAMLARFDMALLLIPVGVQLTVMRIRARQVGFLLLFTAAGAAVVMPWFVWSYAVCGSVMPISGAASRTISQLYGSAAGPAVNPEYFTLGRIPGSFYLHNVEEAVRRILVDSPLNVPVRTLAGDNATAALSWAAGWFVAAWLASRGNQSQRGGSRLSSGEVDGHDRRTEWDSHELKPAARLGPVKSGLREDLERLGAGLWCLWIFCLLLTGAYSFYFFAQWHFWRYLTPCVIALTFPSAVCLDHAWAWAWKGAAARRIVGTGLALLFVSVAVRDRARFFAPPDSKSIAYRIYHDAVELRPLAQSGARIGSFESGTLDYFLGTDVFNLDGKTNARAHREMVAGRMDRLVDALQLEYIVSSPPLLRDLLMRRGDWPQGKLQVVRRLPHNLVLRRYSIDEPRM